MKRSRRRRRERERERERCSLQTPTASSTINATRHIISPNDAHCPIHTAGRSPQQHTQPLQKTGKGVAATNRRTVYYDKTVTKTIKETVTPLEQDKI